jgi:hypothetical protein
MALIYICKGCFKKRTNRDAAEELTIGGPIDPTVRAYKCPLCCQQFTRSEVFALTGTPEPAPPATSVEVPAQLELDPEKRARMRRPAVQQ